MILIDKDIAREQGKNFIPFPDADNNYEPMFYVEDGKELTLRLYDGEEITRKCTYIDSHHFYFGSNCYHIDQFAELCALNRNTAFSKEQITEAIEQLGKGASVRGEALTLEEFARLTNLFTE